MFFEDMSHTTYRLTSIEAVVVREFAVEVTIDAVVKSSGYAVDDSQQQDDSQGGRLIRRQHDYC